MEEKSSEKKKTSLEKKSRAGGKSFSETREQKMKKGEFIQ